MKAIDYLNTHRIYPNRVPIGADEIPLSVEDTEDEADADIGEESAEQNRHLILDG